jgi:hypothetical protein
MSRSGKFYLFPRTTSSLSRCVANSIETATQSHWMPNCQNCLGYSPILQLQKLQQLLFHSSKIRTIHLPQRLQQTFDCLLQRIGIHSTDAIAHPLHLLTFSRQVIVRFEVLQTDRVLGIPHFHSGLSRWGVLSPAPLS